MIKTLLSALALATLLTVASRPAAACPGTPNPGACEQPIIIIVDAKCKPVTTAPAQALAAAPVPPVSNWPWDPYWPW